MHGWLKATRMNWVSSQPQDEDDETKYIFTDIRGFEFFSGDCHWDHGDDYHFRISSKLSRIYRIHCASSHDENDTIKQMSRGQAIKLLLLERTMPLFQLIWSLDICLLQEWTIIQAVS